MKKFYKLGAWCTCLLMSVIMLLKLNIRSNLPNLPGRGKEDTIHTSKGGEWDKNWHDNPHETVQPLREHLKKEKHNCVKYIYIYPYSNFSKCHFQQAFSHQSARHWRNLPTVLDVNSFQSKSLSILVLFLEIEKFLLICDCLDFRPNLFIVTHICSAAWLEKISSRKVIKSLQTFSNKNDKKRLINDLNYLLSILLT